MDNHGYFRVCAASPTVHLADPEKNIDTIAGAMRAAGDNGAEVLVLPELAVTGYTCADLYMQHILLESADRALGLLAAASAEIPDTLVAVGAPVKYGTALYNCAVMLQGGHILGVVPKSYLPNYSEFYEKRWFASGSRIRDARVTVGGTVVPFGPDLLFRKGDALIGIEICEDLWSPLPPSTLQALAGANVILNLSATDEVTGKHDYLLSLIGNQSARLHAAYVYASAGTGESSTDLVYAGNAIICENGVPLRQSKRFAGTELMETADTDLEMLAHDRMASGTFSDTAAAVPLPDYRIIDCPSAAPASGRKLLRRINPDPFVPAADSDRAARCEEIISIQTAGLTRRLQATGCRHLVVGVSGGLDSTLALLIAARAFSNLGLDAKGIIGVTMPGFGTTARTRTNATDLIGELGATLLEINISKAVRQHFEDIGHDENIHDVTYENSQARERTQILMDLANKYNGMVLGTGDLSELALGWCTYNGDQMSMYGINAGVPKTLVRWLVRQFADTTPDERRRDTLLDIIDTPVSPELIPADAQGRIVQKTEDLVGPYRLHDFFLYHLLRHGFAPSKLYRMALAAFDGIYTPEVILHWLKTFCRRFFRQQFKRSCMPDGPKVGSVSLSPRGDWRMPSDASPDSWLRDLPE